MFLFQAHQQSRRADRLLAAGKYEEAISCHKKASGECSSKEILTLKLEGNFFSPAYLNNLFRTKVTIMMCYYYCIIQYKVVYTTVYTRLYTQGCIQG